LFNTDAKIIQRMSPMLQRVLILDPQPTGARLIGELMRDIARSQVAVAETREKAFKLAANLDPQIIFAEMGPTPVDGVAFTRELRRGNLNCRYAPVIMVTGQATAASILAARDGGVHEFLRKPFTLKDLLRRLEAVTMRQRDWVEAVDYVGPDRRRFNSGDYTGALKRRSDSRATPDSEKLSQALKILRSAIGAVDSDPAQAMRAMQAQVAELRKCGMSVADLKLTTAAIDFGRYVDEISRRGPPYNGVALSEKAGPLLAYMPKDEAAVAA
jgi:DNA-binding response OmpR family regulator